MVDILQYHSCKYIDSIYIYIYIETRYRNKA